MLTQHRWVQGWSLNAFGTLFGGQMLSWVDEDTNMLMYNCGVPSGDRNGFASTTAGYERVSFHNRALPGDRLQFNYKIVHVGNKSVTILCTVQNLTDGTPTFSCLTTMVIQRYGLREEVVAAVDKTHWLWELCEQLKANRKKEKSLLEG